MAGLRQTYLPSDPDFLLQYMADHDDDPSSDDDFDGYLGPDDDPFNRSPPLSPVRPGVARCYSPSSSTVANGNSPTPALLGSFLPSPLPHPSRSTAAPANSPLNSTAASAQSPLHPTAAPAHSASSSAQSPSSSTAASPFSSTLAINTSLPAPPYIKQLQLLLSVLPLA